MQPYALWMSVSLQVFTLQQTQHDVILWINVTSTRWWKLEFSGRDISPHIFIICSSDPQKETLAN